MTPALLHSIGNALYGPRWQPELARDLGVSDRTVRRWSAGEHQVPDGIWWDLGIMMDDRRKVLQILLEKTSKAQGETA